jgi:hypothetical protein
LALTTLLMAMAWPALAPTWNSWLVKLPSSSLVPLKSACLATRSTSDQLGHFGLQGLAVAGRVGGVGGLHGQFADALQVVADFAQRTFGDLGQRDAVVGVADGHVQTADLGGEALADGQAGRVVLRAVDAQAGREALDGGSERAAAGAQVALSVERHRIGVDYLCHGVVSSYMEPVGE